MDRLAVPYVSQLVGIGTAEHHNDCGPACVAMLVHAFRGRILSPLDVYQYMPGVSGDTLIGQPTLAGALKALGVECEWKTGLGRADTFRYLVEQRPMIAVISYGVLVDAGLTERRFRGGHFVVLTGVDLTHYYIHDPYRTQGGEYVAIPHAAFEASWSGREGETVPVGGALVPRVSLGAIPAEVLPAGVLFQARVRQELNRRRTPKVADNNLIKPTYKRGDVVSVHEIKGAWYRVGTNEWVSGNYTERI